MNTNDTSDLQELAQLFDKMLITGIVIRKHRRQTHTRPSIKLDGVSVLILLSKQSGLREKDIAKIMGIDKSEMPDLLKPLVKENLIEADKRNGRIELTALGKSKLGTLCSELSFGAGMDVFGPSIVKQPLKEGDVFRIKMMLEEILHRQNVLIADILLSPEALELFGRDR